MFKQRKLPALVARRLEIDQGLYDGRAGRHQSQGELRIRSFGSCGRGSAVCLVSIHDTGWINSGPLNCSPSHPLRYRLQMAQIDVVVG